MKAIIASSFVMLALVIALPATADQSVFSQNAVGYVKINMEPGQLAMLHNTFEPLDPGVDPTPSAVFGSSLPVGTRLFVWDADSQSYQTDTFREEIGPPPTLTVTTNWAFDVFILDPGTAFWLEIPANTDGDTDVVLLGQVPELSEAQVPIFEGLNMVAYSFPTEVEWTETELAQNASVGDRIFFWNTETGSYNQSIYRVEIGPPPDLIETTSWSFEITIPAGKGFWYQSADSKTWSENKPYPWP